MTKKYIKAFVFGFLYIIQFMQCTVLRRSLHMGNSVGISKLDKGKSIKKEGQNIEKLLQLLYIDFCSLFIKGDSGAEDCVKTHLLKYLPFFTAQDLQSCNTTSSGKSFPDLEIDGILLDFECSDSRCTRYRARGFRGNKEHFV